MPELANRDISEITLSDLQDLIDDWAEKTRSYKAIKIYMAKVFAYAVSMELIKKNPCDHLVLPRQTFHYNEGDESKTAFWSKDDLKSFLKLSEEKMHPMWYSFFRLICFSGIRKCEALALHWSDIDFLNQQIDINKTLYLGENNIIKVDVPKTKNSKRIIDIDAKTLHFLLTWKQMKGNDVPYVFSNSNHEYLPLSYPLRVLNSFNQKHELKRITIHGLRHTHCTILFEAGASMKEVQHRLGHSDIKTTLNIYTHVSKRKKSELINLYTEYLNEA